MPVVYAAIPQNVTVEDGFLGIENVRRVEALLLEKFQPAATYDDERLRDHDDGQSDALSDTSQARLQVKP